MTALRSSFMDEPTSPTASQIGTLAVTPNGQTLHFSGQVRYTQHDLNSLPPQGITVYASSMSWVKSEEEHRVIVSAKISVAAQTCRARTNIIWFKNTHFKKTWYITAQNNKKMYEKQSFRNKKHRKPENLQGMPPKPGVFESFLN